MSTELQWEGHIAQGRHAINDWVLAFIPTAVITVLLACPLGIALYLFLTMTK